jgi:hypothetical protein
MSDLFEGGDGPQPLRRLSALMRAGVNVIVLLALTDQGRPEYDSSRARSIWSGASSEPLRSSRTTVRASGLRVPDCQI